MKIDRSKKKIGNKKKKLMQIPGKKNKNFMQLYAKKMENKLYLKLSIPL